MDMDFLKGRRILVTGSTGLMGANTLNRLKDIKDVYVRAVIHNKNKKVCAENISYVKADLTNEDDCRYAVSGIDYIFMFAAKIDRKSTSMNSVLQTLKMNINMLDAAYKSGVKKFLWLSSATAYPASSESLSEEKMFQADPHDSYFQIGWTNRYIEKICEAYALKLKKPMPVIVMRPTVIYGPWVDFDDDKSHVLSTLIKQVVERCRPIEIWGTGKIRRDFVYVDDVVDACFLALEKVNKYDVFNVGSGISHSIRELLPILLDISCFVDAEIIFNKSKPQKAPTLLVDCRRAKEILGFEAKTSLEKGLKKTIEWLTNHKNVFVNSNNEVL